MDSEGTADYRLKYIVHARHIIMSNRTSYYYTRKKPKGSEFRRIYVSESYSKKKPGSITEKLLERKKQFYNNNFISFTTAGYTGRMVGRNVSAVLTHACILPVFRE